MIAWSALLTILLVIFLVKNDIITPESGKFVLLFMFVILPLVSLLMILLLVGFLSTKGKQAGSSSNNTSAHQDTVNKAHTDAATQDTVHVDPKEPGMPGEHPAAQKDPKAPAKHFAESFWMPENRDNKSMFKTFLNEKNFQKFMRYPTEQPIMPRQFPHSINGLAEGYAPVYFIESDSSYWNRDVGFHHPGHSFGGRYLKNPI